MMQKTFKEFISVFKIQKVLCRTIKTLVKNSKRLRSIKKMFVGKTQMHKDFTDPEETLLDIEELLNGTKERLLEMEVDAFIG